MLENWLSPLNVEKLNKTNEYQRTQFGKKLLIHDESIPNLDKAKMAIIGLDTEEANQIRTELYQLFFPFNRLKIADLGNIRNKDRSFLITVIKELLDSNIVPIIIGRNIVDSTAQSQAYHMRNYINITTVDEKIRFSPYRQVSNEDYLNEVLNEKTPRVLNFSTIAYQSHFTAKKLIAKFEELNYESVRLGNIRKKMEDLEPIIRDADLMTFNISALKNLEAPAQKDASPSGLFSEEACQICRYAGLSDKLTSVGFYGLQHEIQDRGMTAKTIAQMIWYFIDGFYNRKDDYPVSNRGLVEYVVEYKHKDSHLHFWKSNKSGRWWLEVPLKNDYGSSEMFPCTYEEYQAASNNELSDRLIKALHRLT